VAHAKNSAAAPSAQTGHRTRETPTAAPEGRAAARSQNTGAVTSGMPKYAAALLADQVDRASTPLRCAPRGVSHGVSQDRRGSLDLDANHTLYVVRRLLETSTLGAGIPHAEVDRLCNAGSGQFLFKRFHLSSRLLSPSCSKSL
jgi:hypothetical protein